MYCNYPEIKASTYAVLQERLTKEVIEPLNTLAKNDKLIESGSSMEQYQTLVTQQKTLKRALTAKKAKETLSKIGDELISMREKGVRLNCLFFQPQLPATETSSLLGLSNNRVIIHS